MIKFPKEFSAAPTVIASMCTDKTHNTTGCTQLAVITTTATQFRLRIYDSGRYTADTDYGNDYIGIQYIAIVPKTAKSATKGT